MLTNFNKTSAMPKLDQKFVGPYRVVEHVSGNKQYKVREISSGQYKESYLDHVKLVCDEVDKTPGIQTSEPHTDNPPDPVPSTSNNPTDVQPDCHYSLRTRQVIRNPQFQLLKLMLILFSHGMCQLLPQNLTSLEMMTTLHM